MSTKDREHRIDTGSPEEIVKAKWPDADIAWYATACVVVNRFANGAVQRWLTGYHDTPEDAWADAASRLETK